MNHQMPEIQPMSTPNPRSVKFMLQKTLLEKGSFNASDPEEAHNSPLALELFNVDHVSGVFIAQNFVTVTVDEDDIWNEMIPRVAAILKSFLDTEKAIIEGDLQSDHQSDDEVEKKILEILDQQIRPAVAMDGGDVAFVNYSDGIVQLKMQGACKSCPSAAATLKMGIEARLRHFVPQVERVEAV